MVKKAGAAGGAEADERRRLRSVAFSKGLLRRGEPAAPRGTALAPSSAVARLQGRDVVRRGGQRRSRFLFSFPGLLAPATAAAAGGRVGELADLGSKNPVLYLEFPQGRMKLFGTHVYPKNKYLTLQMTRSAKGVVCEDAFESLIVFPEACWIGTKEENLEELKLEFPKIFQNDGVAADCDFKGGAGATRDDSITGNKSEKDNIEPRSPKVESEDDAFSEDSDDKDENSSQSLREGASVRQSARIAGKALNYIELSSGRDSADRDNEVPEDKSEKMMSPAVKKENRSSKDNKPVDSSLQLTYVEESLSSKDTLVQAIVSGMFKKAEEKKRSTRSQKGSLATKGPAGKKQQANSKEKANQKVDTVSKEDAKPTGKKRGSGARKKKKPETEDEIEELSSSSQDNIMDDDNDEDWAE